MARAQRLTGGVQLATLLAGAGVGVASLTLGRRSPGFSFVGSSGLAATLELAAGWALGLAGAFAYRSPASRRFGSILALGGLAWFIVDWNNPGVRWVPVFTTGLVFSTVCPILVSHAVLRYPDRRLDRVESVAVGAGYLNSVVVAGLVPALFFDPAHTGCSECPKNLVLVRGGPAVVEWASRAAIYLGPMWAAVLIGVIGLRLVASSPARRRIVAPVLVPAMGYLSLVGLDYLHSAGRGFLGNDTVDRRLWAAQGGLLVAIALGTGWAAVRLRLTRSAVARLVVDAAEVPRTGGLGRALGETLGDDSLCVFYPLTDGRLADSSGRAVEPDQRQQLTRLTRGDATVALLAHRRGLLDVDGVADEITGTARLALDNERLQAERQAQLADLRASRNRIVADAGAERRRLERDLHDGAQQRLVALSLSLQLARLRLDDGADPLVAAQLDEARDEVTAALGALRLVARGLYPRELADEGLAAALETFAESSPIPVSVKSVVDERFPQPVESAAYFAVAHCIGGSEGDGASVLATREDGKLLIKIETSSLHGDLVDLEDRVGALDGTVVAEPIGGAGTRIRVELPCGW